MSGTLTSIPAALPAGLYEQAVGGAGASVPGSPLTAQHTGGSAGGIPRQLTGQPVPSPIAARALSPPPPGSALRSPLSPGTPSGFAPIQAQRTGLGSSMLAAGGAGPGAAWDVTPEDKVKADRFFEGLDTEHKGLLDGQVVVPFFMQSKLLEAVLAHVW